jgi:hypothetical protein
MQGAKLPPSYSDVEKGKPGNPMGLLKAKLFQETTFYSFCHHFYLLSRALVCKEHCYRKKAASIGQNGRLSASCNFFSFDL